MTVGGFLLLQIAGRLGLPRHFGQHLLLGHIGWQIKHSSRRSSARTLIHDTRSQRRRAFLQWQRTHSPRALYLSPERMPPRLNFGSPMAPSLERSCCRRHHSAAASASEFTSSYGNEQLAFFQVPDGPNQHLWATDGTASHTKLILTFSHSENDDIIPAPPKRRLLLFRRQQALADRRHGGGNEAAFSRPVGIAHNGTNH